MFHLKLKKSKSYTGHGITVTAAAPDIRIRDKATAAALEASGYFEICPDGTPDTVPPTPPSGTITTIDTMNTTQLRAFAKENELDIEEIAPKGSPVELVRKAVQDAIIAKEGQGAPDANDDIAGQFASQLDEE